MKGTSSFNESRLLAMKLNAHVFSSEHPMMDDGCVDCVGSVGCACLRNSHGWVEVSSVPEI